MADRWAVANGLWSTGSTWNGGTLPTSGDTVYADGKTVSIDMDITVISINTTQRTGGTAGGTFTCNTARNITANIVAGSGFVLNLSHTVGNTVTVTGNVTGTILAVNNIWAIQNSSTGQIDIVGNITSGSAAASYGLYNTSTGTVNITGNLTAINYYAVYCVGICSITITGTIAGNGAIYGFYTPVMPSSLTFDPNLCTNTNALYVGGAGTYDLTVNSGTCYGIQMPNLVGGSFISTVGAQNCSFGGVTTDVSGGDIISCTFNSTTINLSTPSNTGIIRGVTIGGTGNAMTITNNIIATTVIGLTISSTRQITIIGNIVAATAAGVWCTTVTNLIIEGNLTAGNVGNAACRALELLSSGNVTITGNIIGGSSVNSCWGINNASSAIINITGNITGGNGQSSYGINNSSSGVVNIIGTVQGGTTASFPWGINNSGIVNVTGNIYGGTNGYGIYHNTGTLTITADAGGILKNNASLSSVYNVGSATINIIGNLQDQTGIAPFITNNANGTINVTGNIIGNAVATATGIIHNFAGGTVNITGDVYGGSQLTAYAVVNNSTGNVYITGNITGGTSATGAPALYSITNGKFDVSGNATADGTSAIVSIGQTATNIIRGNFVNNGTVSPYCCRNITVSASPVVIIMTMRDTSGADRILSTDNAVAGQPTEADVRYATLYGLVNERTGTLRVPNPMYVSQGVLTDNTVGTLVFSSLSAADVWNYQTSGATMSGSMGERLKNCSTVETTGDQIVNLI